MHSAFNDSGIPLAYFISFRCYGTWLHGDDRGSVDRLHNVYGTPLLGADPILHSKRRALMKRNPVELDAARRRAVKDAVVDTCSRRGWVLRAINVRTNHVHCVVTADRSPELVMNAFKANATSRMVAESVWRRGIKPWSRHGSTRYLWNENSVVRAIDYVINGQGDDLPVWD